ncbi:hypothetical protein BV898_15455 [Hypsibius exemplaris]|uniref:Uncharacterized protein n=1 Tax=Hypsibius exemplaris TaxID=2072580 RepID=A0A9X6NCV3_HYPEX|nr:hypothetical protein BV898_15455 [Hypsibius exemplaris]
MKDRIQEYKHNRGFTLPYGTKSGDQQPPESAFSRNTSLLFKKVEHVLATLGELQINVTSLQRMHVVYDNMSRSPSGSTIHEHDMSIATLALSSSGCAISAVAERGQHELVMERIEKCCSKAVKQLQGTPLGDHSAVSK